MVEKSLDGIEAQLYFYNQVNHGGDWDYKLKEKWKNDIKVPYLELDGKFLYHGKVTTAEDFGNIHFEFVGMVTEFNPTVLYIGGGYAKCKLSIKIFEPPFYCDDSNDHYNIQRGIDMYYNWKN